MTSTAFPRKSEHPDVVSSSPHLTFGWLFLPMQSVIRLDGCTAALSHFSQSQVWNAACLSFPCYVFAQLRCTWDRQWRPTCLPGLAPEVTSRKSPPRCLPFLLVSFSVFCMFSRTRLVQSDRLVLAACGAFCVLGHASSPAG